MRGIAVGAVALAVFVSSGGCGDKHPTAEKSTTTTTSSTTSTSTTIAPAVGDPRSLIVVGESPGGTTSTTTAGARPAPNSQPSTVACTTIVIGSAGQQSGPVGARTLDGVKTVAVWAAAVNGAGGLRCHPVRYVVRDDGGDPARNLAVTRHLVEQDHVIALVHTTAPASGHAAVSYLNAKRVPVIGSEGESPWFGTSPMYFPQAASAAGLYEVLAATAGVVGQAQAKTKLAVLACREEQLCRGFFDEAPDLATKNGLKLVFRTQASPADPDYGADCANAVRVDAQIFAVFMDGNSLGRIARDCGPRPYTSVISRAPFPPSSPNVDGLTVGTPVIPWTITTNAQVMQLRNALRRYAPTVVPGPSAVAGWTSARLFERAARNIGDAPTSQAILDGLWSIKAEDLGGLTGPLTFVKDGPAPRAPACYWLLQVRAGDYASPDGGQRRCAS